MVLGQSNSRSLLRRSLGITSVLPPSLAATAVLLAASPASAGVPPPPIVHGRIVLSVGDTPTDGPAVASVNVPFVNGQGTVGFDGLFDNGDHYVWVDDAVVWSGSDDMNFVFSDLEVRMDSNGQGNWVYPIDGNGLDGLYTDAGPFAFATDPTVDPMDATYVFLGNTSMNDDGAIYYLASVAPMGGGGLLALYHTPDGTHDSSEIVYAGSTDVDMITLDPQGVGANYAVSEDGAHMINVLYSDEGNGQNNYLRVDDAFVAHQSEDNGDGDTWGPFQLVSINANGNYVFTGNLNGAAGPEYIAYNGTVGVTAGDSVAGVDLPTNSNLRFISVTDNEQLVYGWLTQTMVGFREHVFLACDADDIAGSSELIFTTVDYALDVDDDDMPDYQIDDLVFNSPTISRTRGESDFLYVPLTLNDGMTAADAMVEVPITCCGNGAVNGGEECDDANTEDTDDCLSTCVAATCGDGFVWDGMETCDDGNTDDTDDCPSTCEPATCGDGFVWDGMEECDDGNTEDGDGCAADCTMESGDTGDTGGNVDDTGGSEGGMEDTGGTPPPVTTAGLETGGETEGDTETEGGGGATDSGGCSCRSTTPPPAALFGLTQLGLLGLRRRR